MRWDAERILDAGDEAVVALVRMAGRGATSGLDVKTPTYGVVFTVGRERSYGSRNTPIATAPSKPRVGAQRQLTGEAGQLSGHSRRRVTVYRIEYVSRDRVSGRVLCLSAPPARCRLPARAYSDLHTHARALLSQAPVQQIPSRGHEFVLLACALAPARVCTGGSCRDLEIAAACEGRCLPASACPEDPSRIYLPGPRSSSS
jgi:hypothetical protein